MTERRRTTRSSYGYVVVVRVIYSRAAQLREGNNNKKRSASDRGSELSNMLPSGRCLPLLLLVIVRRRRRTTSTSVTYFDIVVFVNMYRPLLLKQVAETQSPFCSPLQFSSASTFCDDVTNLQLVPGVRR